MSAFTLSPGFTFLVSSYSSTLISNKASSSFDEEGVPTQKTKIIDKGVLKTYLHNTSTAKKHNVKTTGNAGLISPNASNLILEGGSGNPFDVKKGIYVTNLWYTRFQNYATGDFSTIPRDGMFLIENGEITKPVKNPALEITTPVLWSSIDAVGNNSAMFAGTCGKGEPMQGIPVWMGGPSVRLRNVRIS